MPVRLGHRLSPNFKWSSQSGGHFGKFAQFCSRSCPMAAVTTGERRVTITLGFSPGLLFVRGQWCSRHAKKRLKRSPFRYRDTI